MGCFIFDEIIRKPYKCIMFSHNVLIERQCELLLMKINFTHSSDVTFECSYKTLIPLFLCSITLIVRKNDVKIASQDFKNYSTATRRSTQKFENNYDVIFIT